MKHFFPFVLFASTHIALGQTNVVIDRQHIDLRVNYNAAAAHKLSISIRDGDSQASYSTNEALLVVTPSAKYDGLPPGTPFGNEGDPLWILPQSQDPQLLYLGLSAAGINNGIFTGNTIDLRLNATKAPGHFFAWQTDEFGGFNVKMNSRDGIGPLDKTTLIVGSHEHLNWGFSTNGVYCITFQVAGVRVGEATNTMSLPASVQFNVLPLRPFERWQSNHWQFATPDALINPAADPDQDGVVNAFEYALGSNPTDAASAPSPSALIVENQGTSYAAIRFSRPKNLLDVAYSVVAADSINGPWTTIASSTTVSDLGEFESVTIRDEKPIHAQQARFLRLQVELIGPANYGCGCF